MKNLLVKCIETFLVYIFLIKKSFQWHDYYKFLSLKVHFTLKIIISWMDFLVNHMCQDIHKLAY
jgi:hypothetical protein